MRPLRCNSIVCFCCLQELEVQSPPGVTVGWVKQNCSLLAPRFSVMNEYHQVLYRVNGPCFSCKWCDVEFQVREYEDIWKMLRGIIENLWKVLKYCLELQRDFESIIWEPLRGLRGIIENLYNVLMYCWETPRGITRTLWEVLRGIIESLLETHRGIVEVLFFYAGTVGLSLLFRYSRYTLVPLIYCFSLWFNLCHVWHALAHSTMFNILYTIELEIFDARI